MSTACRKPVVLVDHGNVFGTGTWFTFYCPECDAHLNPALRNLPCRCGYYPEWPQDEGIQIFSDDTESHDEPSRNDCEYVANSYGQFKKHADVFFRTIQALMLAGF
jgi:hypothetical protein